jgi:hypothetical protein
MAALNVKLSTSSAVRARLPVQCECQPFQLVPLRDEVAPAGILVFRFTILLRVLRLYAHILFWVPAATMLFKFVIFAMLAELF